MKRNYLFLFLLLLGCSVENLEDLDGVAYLEGSSSTDTLTASTGSNAIKEYAIEDPDCTDGLADIGEATMWLLDINEEPAIVDQEIEDLTGIAGNPISSKYIESVTINAHTQIIKEGCTQEGTAVSCLSYKTEIVSEGEEARICQTSYDRDSLENHVLAAVTSVHKTLECLDNFLPDDHNIPPIDIQVYPKKETVYNFTDGGSTSVFESDNAYHSYSTATGSSIIAFLPHKERTLNSLYSGNEFVLNLGIGAHETGHYLFNLQTGPAYTILGFLDGLANHLNYRIMSHEGANKETTRDITSRMIYKAFNEGLADAVSTLCFYESNYANLRFSQSEADVRDVEVDVVLPWLPTSASTSTIEGIKTLSASRLQNFYSAKTVSSINGLPNDQDVHHIGAIIFYGMLKYWEALGVKVLNNDDDADRAVQLEKASAYLMEAIKSIGQTIPNREPDVYMSDLVFAVLKGAMNFDETTKKFSVSNAACEVIQEQFPVAYITIQNSFDCI